MRTTLDLDETVLAAARSMAKARGCSMGDAVSELALRGLRSGTDDMRATADFAYSPFPVIVGDPHHIVTDELVAAHRDD